MEQHGYYIRYILETLKKKCIKAAEFDQLFEAGENMDIAEDCREDSIIS